MNYSINRYEKMRGYLYISLALLFFILFLFYPIIFSLILSFYEWSGFSPIPFEKTVGIDNYVRMIQDPTFWLALKNTLYFVFFTIVFQNFLGLLIALFLFYGQLKGSGIWRSIIFFPAMLSSVMIGLVWRRIFMGDGLLNMIITSVNPALDGVQWLGNTVTPIFVIIFINVWQWTGYNMVLYYAGLQGVNEELIDSAKIDGASWRQTVVRIVVPQLYKTISLAIILNIIGGFKVFDLVYVMTGGGPAHSSEVVTTYIYFQSFAAFGTNRMGYSSALAVVLTFIVLVFAIIRIKIESKVEA